MPCWGMPICWGCPENPAAAYHRTVAAEAFHLACPACSRTAAAGHTYIRHSHTGHASHHLPRRLHGGSGGVEEAHDVHGRGLGLLGNLLLLNLLLLCRLLLCRLLLCRLLLWDTEWISDGARGRRTREGAEGIGVEAVVLHIRARRRLRRHCRWGLLRRPKTIVVELIESSTEPTRGLEHILGRSSRRGGSRIVEEIDKRRLFLGLHSLHLYSTPIITTTIRIKSFLRLFRRRLPLNLQYSYLSLMNRQLRDRSTIYRPKVVRQIALIYTIHPIIAACFHELNR